MAPRALAARAARRGPRAPHDCRAPDDDGAAADVHGANDANGSARPVRPEPQLQHSPELSPAGGSESGESRLARRPDGLTERCKSGNLRPDHAATDDASTYSLTRLPSGEPRGSFCRPSSSFNKKSQPCHLKSR